MLKRWLVRAYTKTGIYAEIVSAATEQDAKRIARPALKRMAFGRIIRIEACLDD